MARAANYLPYDPQQMLLPEAIQDWLPEGHLAHFISDTVDTLDLGALHARYDKDGPRNQPFHPAMMVKLLVYDYAKGVFSSRKIARKLHEGVAFRVLVAGNFPAHRTIRDFRAFHLKELSELFLQVVRLAREMGLVRRSRCDCHVVDKMEAGDHVHSVVECMCSYRYCRAEHSAVPSDSRTSLTVIEGSVMPPQLGAALTFCRIECFETWRPNLEA